MHLAGLHYRFLHVHYNYESRVKNGDPHFYIFPSVEKLLVLPLLHIQDSQKCKWDAEPWGCWSYCIQMGLKSCALKFAFLKRWFVMQSRNSNTVVINVLSWCYVSGIPNLHSCLFVDKVSCGRHQHIIVSWIPAVFARMMFCVSASQSQDVFFSDVVSLKYISSAAVIKKVPFNPNVKSVWTSLRIYLHGAFILLKALRLYWASAVCKRSDEWLFSVILKVFKCSCDLSDHTCVCTTWHDSYRGFNILYCLTLTVIAIISLLYKHVLFTCLTHENL